MYHSVRSKLDVSRLGGLFIHHAISSDAFSTMMARCAIRWRGAPLKLYEVCPRLPARGVNKSNNEFVTITRAPRLLRSAYLYRTFAYEINRIKKNGNVRGGLREKEGKGRDVREKTNRWCR